MTITREELVLAQPQAAGQQPDRPPEPLIWGRLDPLAEVYAALVTGTRDYVRKNGFRSVILGLSGGIDSALVATIAADALGPDQVHVVLMPSKYSSGHSVSDAEDLAKRQELQARTVPIAPMVDAFEAELDLAGLAAENLQSRIRGVILMGLSNAAGHLVLTTGQQERDRHRVLHPVRRLGGWLRPDQGRAQDAGLGPGPVAQREGGGAW